MRYARYKLLNWTELKWYLHKAAASVSCVFTQTTTTTTVAGRHVTLEDQPPASGQRLPMIRTNGGRRRTAGSGRTGGAERRDEVREHGGQWVARDSWRRWSSSTKRWLPITADHASNTTSSCWWTSYVCAGVCQFKLISVFGSPKTTKLFLMQILLCVGFLYFIALLLIFSFFLF